MIVVADAPPLNYLVLIEETGILKTLYGRVVIPFEVYGELMSSGAPARVAKWMRPYPDGLMSGRLEFP